MSKEMKKTLEKFSNINGASGFEEKVSNLFKAELKNYADTFEYDNLGSIAAIKKGSGKGPKIMVAAHIDEIGFVVTEILKTGYLKITPVGGWWGHVLLSQLLTITTRSGKEIVGIVGSIPPHILPFEATKKVVQVKDMFIDIGASSKEEVKKSGIVIGDFVTPKAEYFEMVNPNFVAGKAMDNRAAVAMGIEMMKELKNEKHESDVYLVGTVQEEVGLRGARTSAMKWKPDIAFAIDVTISTDYPGAPGNQTNLGDGIALSIMDRSIIGNPKLIRYIEEIAKKNKIKFSYDAMTGGGTDAGAIHLSGEGVITMTLSIPSRYIHSHYAVVNTEDLVAGKNILKEFIKAISHSDLENKLKTK